MIYLKEGNIPLNFCFEDDISQEANNTYQLSFKFPVSDDKWASLKNEVHLLADDLSGEQEFVIIDVQKGHGYITVYANQVATLLNGHSVRKIDVDRSNGMTVMNKLVEGLKRECPFTFFSDIQDKHTLRLDNVSVIDALTKGQHSIIGQWGGDLIRDKYSVRLLKNGGIENQSLFMYKKNLSEYKESTTTKSLKTRIHFRKVITASGEGEKEKVLEVTVDSPLVDKYKHIYEYDMEVQDQDVKTLDDLKEYGKKYFQSSLCDLPEENLEINVIGQADQPVKLFDTASIYYELYNVDIRKKITKYSYSPMAKKLKKIGFGKISRSLGGAIGQIINDSVADKIASHDAAYDAKVQQLIDNANDEYDKKAKSLEQDITDGIEQAKAKAEVVKEEINAEISEKIKAANKANKDEIVEEFKAKYNGIEVKVEDLKATANGLSEMNTAIQQEMDSFKASTASKFAGISGAQSHYEQSTNKAISDLMKVTQNKADQAYVEQTTQGIKETISNIKIGRRNLIKGTRLFSGVRGVVGEFNGFKVIRSEITQENQKVVDPFVTNTTVPMIGTEYTAVFWARASRNDYQCVLHLFSPNSVTKVVTSTGFAADNLIDGYAKFAITNEWRPYWVKWTQTPVNVPKRVIFGRHGANYGQKKGDWLEICAPAVFEGNMPGDWNEAPEDATSTFQAEFEKTAKGLETKITSFESYVQADGTRQETLKKYIEDKTASSLTAFREDIESGYISKSKYEEDSRGITRRFEELKTGGQNLVLNSGNPQNMKNWGEISPDSEPTAKIVTSPLYFNGTRNLLAIINRNNAYSMLLSSHRFNVRQKTTYTVGVTLFCSENLKGADLVFFLRRRGSAQLFDKAIDLLEGIQLPSNEAKRFYFRINSEIYDEAFLRFKSSGKTAGDESVLYIADVDVYEGTIERPWQAAEDEAGKKLETKLAEYSQTVDGELKKLASQIDDTIKKTDVNITPGQITFGVGKTINGKTISSLFVQDPESIALISKLIKVKGDMIVDGSILGRHLKTGTLETGHFKAGSVTSEILAANAVTADKIQVDHALISKLIANQAFIRELTSQRAFITQINSIDFSAERMQGGRLLSINKATDFNLNDGSINLYSNTGVIRRIDDTTSSEFIKLNQGGFIGERVRDSKAARIIIGTNHDKTENTENETFAGTRLWSGKSGAENESLYEVVSDRIIFYSNGRYRSPWIIHNNTRDGSSYLIPGNEKGVRHNLGRGDKHFSGAWIDNIFIGKNAYNVGTYLWDLLTCLGQISKYGWDLKNQNIRSHITGVLNKYSFK
ncbi:gp58-like protein [Streptococcus gordonii]|uniref:phage tail spike protein n=1 Tax=Streptococcus gordonii TaxID=1302 RepID=UPI000FBCA7CB|nr:phage tail spike protein [Streptococcus gordonii]RSJ59132.1 gp58-like protein [Streptococcus gordonii]RSK10062.1 gp58-like protein [Streptococcus gordonii]